MNKNPWLIAGTIAAAVATVASFRASFPAAERVASNGASSRYSGHSYSTGSRMAKVRSRAADHFDSFTANAAAAVTSIASADYSPSYGGGSSCDTSSSSVSYSSCDTGSY